MSKCTKCLEDKTSKDFYIRKDNGKLSSWCKRCASKWSIERRKANPAQAREYWNSWHKNDREKNPEKVKKQVRKATLKMKYGITLEQYQEMNNRQNGVCFICKQKDTKDLSVDHNHITGTIRGLLCGPCNLLIGNSKEDIKILKSAIKYLEERK